MTPAIHEDLLHQVATTYKENKAEEARRKQEFRQLLTRAVRSGVPRKRISEATGIAVRTISSIINRK